MNAYALGVVAGDPHGSASLISKLSMPTFEGAVTASADVQLTSGYVNEVFPPIAGYVNAGVNIQVNVTDDGGNTRCSSSLAIIGQGTVWPNGGDVTPGTYTAPCTFEQRPSDDGNYTIDVSLNAFVTLVGGGYGEAQATGTLESVGLQMCPVMSTVVDLQSGNCLDLSYADPVIHNPVGEYPCVGSVNQAWQFASDKSLRGMGGLCLNITGGDPAANGTGMQVYPCNPIANNAQWVFNGDLLESIGPGNSCLTSPSGTATQQLVTWTCGEHDYQAWTLR